VLQERHLYAQRQARRLDLPSNVISDYGKQSHRDSGRLVIFARAAGIEASWKSEREGRIPAAARHFDSADGYTVSLNAAPRSADSGGKETMDSEGKVTGGGGKGKTPAQSHRQLRPAQELARLPTG